jgi:hypothetical protein
MQRNGEGIKMRCSLCSRESIDSFEIECGNNAEYAIEIYLCQKHLLESETLGYAFEEKYGKEFETILNDRIF